MSEYNCKGCGKVILDPGDDPIYLVRDDEYWCSQECLDKHVIETM